MYKHLHLSQTPKQKECLRKPLQKDSLCHESWTTDRKWVNTGQDFQFDIKSASNIYAQLYLSTAHQKT